MIGVAFVYLLLTLLVTGINEWISGMFAMSAKTLRRAITRTVEAPAFIATGEKIGKCFSCVGRELISWRNSSDFEGGTS